MSLSSELLERFHTESDDQRDRTARDRDRVLYASAFSRLSGVTQVAPAEEGHPYHNRLTHSLKVAQIARRVAEHLLDASSAEASVLHIDPDTCEASALAHDLGHPPFGHIAEKQLAILVAADGKGAPAGDPDPDGFEGNAQSFRIVTRLAQRREAFDGLNLTAAVLDAVLKYPWQRGAEGTYRNQKFGVYRSEREYFDWARRPAHEAGDDTRSANAEIMDWADDVAYAVHDVEDFYRSGHLPLDRLFLSGEERRRFLTWVRDRWSQRANDGWTSPIPLDDWDLAHRTLQRLFRELAFNRFIEPYNGTSMHRKLLRLASALMISRYLNAVSIADGKVRRALPQQQEVELLKELVWFYVIDRPVLRTQQRGQELIIQHLFRVYAQAAKDGDLAALPVGMRESVGRDGPRRAASDAIASMTERQAVTIWRRLTGVVSGTLADYPAY